MKKPRMDVIDKPWSKSIEEVCKHFDVSVEKGLGRDDVRRLRERYGANALREVREKGILEILLNQFKSLIVILLCVAAALSFRKRATSPTLTAGCSQAIRHPFWPWKQDGGIRESVPGCD